MNDTTANFARLLWQWLPAHWRERDGGGELEALLAVYGELLDALQACVVQRAGDVFAERDGGGPTCQDWLLPYLAQLVDARLVSPDADGRRAEISEAVAWRQRKGTRVALEAIAEAVGAVEVELQEGWKRVAMTPRVDRALLPEAAYGEPALTEPATPWMRACHPGLPAVTLDLRYGSRALRCDTANAGAHVTRFAGQRLAWRQANRHGVPCAADSYQDVSKRVVDLRTPDAADALRGLYHPRRVLLHLPPPEGLCSPHAASIDWGEVLAMPEYSGPLLHVTRGSIEWNGATLPLISYRGLGALPPRLHGVVRFTERAVYRFENLWLDHRVRVDGGAVQLSRCAVRDLWVTTAVCTAPVIEARGCLIKRLSAARGAVRLEYVTLLETLLAERLEASDCIVLPQLRKDTVDADVPASGCVRYSRIDHLPARAIVCDASDARVPFLDNDPRWRSQKHRSLLRCHTASCTGAKPLFVSAQFGESGCGVLHPAAPEALLGGAEDGGELGAYHDDRLVLRRRALQEKLRDFLPLGIEAVLVDDPTLAEAPPQATQT